MKLLTILAILFSVYSCQNSKHKTIVDYQSKIDSLTTELNVLKSSPKRVKNNQVHSNEGFNDFFNLFMSDSVFQKSRIKFPLIYHTVDMDSFEQIKLSIKSTEWKYDSFYFNTASERTQIYDNYDLKFNPTNYRMLHWYGIESGGDMRYYFEGVNGKWYLVKKTDSGV